MQFAKTKILSACLLLGTTLLAASASASDAPSQITTSDYGDFLNKTASRDEFHFDDEKMEVDLGSASIMRSGVPGSYCYEVVTGKEKMPVNFLNYNDVVQYCAWKSTNAVHSPNLQPVVSSLSIDPELKSNILTFSLVSSGATASQASGVAAAGATELDEILGGVVEVIALGAAGAEGIERSNDDEQVEAHEELEPQENFSSLILPAPALDAVYEEDRQKAEFATLFQKSATRDSTKLAQEDEVIKNLLSHSQQAWDARATAKENYSIKNEALEHAREQFEKEKIILENKNIEKTFLGRVANAMNKGSTFASAANTPVLSVSGLLSGVGTLADIANRKWEKKSFKKAKHDFETACEEQKKADQEFKGPKLEFNKANAEIKIKQDQAEKEEIAATMRLAEVLKPPVLSSQKSDWETWASVFEKNLSPHSFSIEQLALKGLEDPVWAAHQAAAAWKKRMQCASEELQQVQEEKKNALEPIQTERDKILHDAGVAREAACNAQLELEHLFKEENEAEEDYEETDAIFTKLENEKNKTLLILETLKHQKEIVATAYLQMEKASAYRKDHETEKKILLERTTQNAIAANKKALTSSLAFNAVEEFYDIKIKRIEARIKADQAAWRRFWPEEVLNSKLQEKIGETAFADAMKEQSEMGWNKARDEALELMQLWEEIGTANRIFAKTVPPAEKTDLNNAYQKIIAQKTAWQERAMVAHGKGIFVKVKNFWIPFVEALHTFITNSNFKPDFDNATATQTGAKDVASTLEEMGAAAAPVSEATRVISLTVRTIGEATKQLANAKRAVDTTPLQKQMKEAVTKINTARENVEPTWKEDISWLAEEINSLAQKVAMLRNSEEKKIAAANSSAAPIVIHKHYYNTQVRYMRSRRNFASRMDFQKDLRIEKQKTYAKNEKRLKGKKVYLTARKQLAAEWPLKNRDSNVVTELQLPVVKAPDIDYNNPSIAIFTDIPEQEKLLEQETIVLDQEKAEIEKLTTRETALIEESEALNKKSQEITTPQEREVLAQQAESLEARAAIIPLDDTAWAQLDEKFTHAAELEKAAEVAEISLAELAWKQACDEALSIEKLWSEILQENEKKLAASTLPSEKTRLNFEIKTAQTEKATWAAKAGECSVRAEEAATEATKKAEENISVAQLIKDAETKINAAAKLDEDTAAAFAHTENEETSTTEELWSKTAHVARNAESAWNEVIEAHQKILSEHAVEISEEEKIRVTAGLEKATSQQEFWNLKAAVADSEAALIKTQELYPNFDEVAETNNAKATFVRAQKVWALFSRAIRIFVKDPSEKNLRAASAAASNASDALYAVYAAVISNANYGEARLAGDSASTASGVARLAVNIASVDVDNVVAYAAGVYDFYDEGASVLAASAAGTSWEKETAWAAKATQETVDFCNLVAEFRTKQNQEVRSDLENSLREHAADISEEEKSHLVPEIESAETQKILQNKDSVVAEIKAALSKIITTHWASFSLHAKAFMANPNEGDLNAARAAKTAMTQAAIADADAAYVAAVNDADARASYDAALDNFLNERTGGYYKKIPEGFANAINDAVDRNSAIAAVFHAVDYAVDWVRCAGASYTTREERVAMASWAVGTIWEKEALWAAHAALDIADFKKAAKKFEVQREAVKQAAETLAQKAADRQAVALANEAAAEEKKKGSGVDWRKAAENYEKASSSWTKCVEVAHEHLASEKLAELYQQAAEHYNDAADNYAQLAIASEQGKSEEKERFYAIAHSAWRAADNFTQAAEVLHQSFLNSKETAFYQELAEQYKIAADCRSRAVEAYKQGRREEASGLEEKSRSIRGAADSQRHSFQKQNEAEELDKTAMAAFAHAEHAETPKTEALWSEAAQSARNVEASWNEVAKRYQEIISEKAAKISEEEKTGMTAAVERATSRQEFWNLKAAVANSEASLIQAQERYPNKDAASQTTIAKATFVRAQKVWALFSRAIRIFKENPNEENLKAASAAADDARAYNAAEVAKAAEAAFFAASIYYDTFGVHAGRTVRWATALTAKAANDAIGTPMETETRWAATAAQEAADFCELVANFRRKQVTVEAAQKQPAEPVEKQTAESTGTSTSTLSKKKSGWWWQKG